jgi:hypothetical protein
LHKKRNFLTERKRERKAAREQARRRRKKLEQLFVPPRVEERDEHRPRERFKNFDKE